MSISTQTLNRPIDAVIFDLDGTLFDTERLRLTLFKQASLQCIGFELSDAYLEGCLGLNERSAAALAKQFYAEPIPFLEIRQRVHELEMRYVMEHGVPLKPGIIELLQHCHSLKLRLGIATSNRRDTVEHLLSLAQIDHFFQCIVCGHEVEHGKPHPEIFITAAEKLNVAPQHCLMIEDSENGFHSADQAGGVTVIIPDIKAPTAFMSQHADFIYADAHALLADFHRFTDGKTLASSANA